jgi:hypothetical protein
MALIRIAISTPTSVELHTVEGSQALLDGIKATIFYGAARDGNKRVFMELDHGSYGVQKRYEGAMGGERSVMVGSHLCRYNDPDFLRGVNMVSEWLGCPVRRETARPKCSMRPLLPMRVSNSGFGCTISPHAKGPKESKKSKKTRRVTLSGPSSTQCPLDRALLAPANVPEDTGLDDVVPRGVTKEELDRELDEILVDLEVKGGVRTISCSSAKWNRMRKVRERKAKEACRRWKHMTFEERLNSALPDVADDLYDEYDDVVPRGASKADLDRELDEIAAERAEVLSARSWELME